MNAPVADRAAALAAHNAQVERHEQILANDLARRLADAVRAHDNAQREADRTQVETAQLMAALMNRGYDSARISAAVVSLLGQEPTDANRKRVAGWLRTVKSRWAAPRPAASRRPVAAGRPDRTAH